MMHSLRSSSQPETGQADLGGDQVRNVVGDAWELRDCERHDGTGGGKEG